MNNKRYLTQLVIGVGTASIAAWCLAPTIIEKTNENVESKFDRVRNIIGIYAGFAVAGFCIGTLIDVNENQIRFVEACKQAVEASI